MPTVFRNGRFRFHFYADEGTPREPVHIHVESGEDTAKFWIRPNVKLSNSRGYDVRTLRKLEKIVERHADLIEESWNEFFR